MLALPRRRLLAASALAACAGIGSTRVRACEVWTGSFRILHPWTRASAPEARDAAVCLVIDDIQEADRLVGAATPVAERAEMGGEHAAPEVDWAFAPGRSVELSENGTYLRLVGLRFPLQVGRSYPLRLDFEVAGPVFATLSVDFGRFR